MFLTELFEQQTTKHAAFCFGRMNPPTVGHGQLIDTVAQASQGGDYFIFVSQTQDKKKNPLDYATKIKFVKALFPQHAGHVVYNPELKTIMQVANWLYSKGYRSVTFVAGSDRLASFKELLTKYNGQEDGYNFDSINFVSSGDRDPDADGIAGVSASSAREAASQGNFELFAQATGAGKLAKPLYDAVRKGMLLEGTFTNSEVRYMPGSGRGEWASNYTWKHDDKYGWHVRDPKGVVVYKSNSKEAVKAKCDELNSGLNEQDEIAQSAKLGQFIWDLYSWFNKAMPDANVDIKQAGSRVWTRGDGTRHRDPARILFKDVASRDQGFELLAQALKGVRRTQVSGEFGSDPHQDAVIWKDKVFHKYGDFSIAVGSKSRVTNPNSVWREKPVAESEMTPGELRDMYNYYVNVKGMSPEEAERLVYTRDEKLDEDFPEVHNSILHATKSAKRQDKKVVKSAGGYFKVVDKSDPLPELVPNEEYLVKQRDLIARIKDLDNKRAQTITIPFEKERIDLADKLWDSEQQKFIDSAAWVNGLGQLHNKYHYSPENKAISKEKDALNKELTQLRKTGKSYVELTECSGYIPKNKREAKDPRWSNALTVDVHPDTPRKNMKALGLI